MVNSLDAEVIFQNISIKLMVNGNGGLNGDMVGLTMHITDISMTAL